jgi:hypothetical protein
MKVDTSSAPRELHYKTRKEFVIYLLENFGK